MLMPFARRSPLVRLALLVLSVTAVLSAASPAAAQDQIYFPATDNTINTIVNYIYNENVRIDISAWYLTEHAISIAIANRFQAGVPVRLIGDRGSIFEIDPNTKAEFYWLANYGVPIRLRYNPTWYPEIDHWKMAYFKGQNTVEFGSANWVTFELAPSSSSNFDDETVMFTTDPVLVGAFATKFDQLWNDTTVEPESVISGPPYLKNWYDACSTESTCDFRTQYPNPAPMSINTARLEPDNPMPADLIWGQGPDFNNRLDTEINNENASLAFVIYRLTVDDITKALLSKAAAGLPMQLIIEPNEYQNRKWPEFWLTHANIDKLWAAGVPIKWRTHQGMTHMKTLVTSAYATNASSNYAAGWQRDHNYFVSASAKPSIYSAIANRVQAMWNDSTNFTWFQPQPADAAVQQSPASGSTGVSTTPTLTWDRAAFATSYDIYMGPAGSNMSLVGNVPAVLTSTPPTTYSWTPASPLATGTSYNWQVVSRTFATPKNPSLTAASSTWSFTTSAGSGGGGTGGPLPSPWTSQDVGSVGTAGSSTYSNGTFTVSGSGTIWGTADGMQFASQPISGDTTVVARVTGVQNTSSYAKAGIMIRDSTAASGAHVLIDLRPTGDIEFMTRSSDGAATTFLAGAFQSPPTWLKLVRSGTTVTGYVSSNGSTWTTVGSTTLNIPSSALAGLAVCSVTSGLNASTFDNVSVTAGGTAPPPPTTASNVVIYASDVASSGIHGSWSTATAAGSPNSIKLVTPDNGVANTSNALAAPTDYVDVTFNAVAGTPYQFWMRLQATANSKYNDSVWVQFSGANNYPIGSTSGLLVNLATDSTGSSLSGWGWQNAAYWISQPTVITFNTTGTQTVRVQVREDGVQFDQIVLSPSQYYSSAPGPVSNDTTIVPK